MYNSEKFCTDIDYLKGLGLTEYEARDFLLNLIIDIKEGLA